MSLLKHYTDLCPQEPEWVPAQLAEEATAWQAEIKRLSDERDALRAALQKLVALSEDNRRFISGAYNCQHDRWAEETEDAYTEAQTILSK